MPPTRRRLCEAASRPDVKFVPAKSVEQQGILALHSARSLLVKQQTMLANAMRGLATEFGLTVPKGISKLDDLMALVDADETIPEEGPTGDHGIASTTAAQLAEGIESIRSGDRRSRAAR